MSTELDALGQHGTGQQEASRAPTCWYEDATPPAPGTTQQSSRGRRMCRALPRCSASQQVCQVRSACLPRTHVVCHRTYHSRHGYMKRKPMRCAKPCTQSIGRLLLGWAVDAGIGSAIFGACRRSCEEKRRGCEGEARHALRMPSIPVSSP